MGAPVVHFEIYGQNEAELQEWYRKLFDWHVDSDNPMSYGVVDTHGEGGINGGIAKTDFSSNGVSVFIEVDDLQATLDRIEAAGGKTVVPVTEMGVVTLAMFTDPAGNRIGLVKSREAAG